MNNPYTTEAEIERVVNDFETCRTSKDEFHHAQHLVVAITYLESLSEEAAVKKMRNALLRFLEHHAVGKQKYNETLTAFWLEMVSLELKKLPASATLVHKCNSVIAALNNPKLASEYYSDEVLWSEKARKAFVSPDLKQWNRSFQDKYHSKD
jgi:hypothetical protein